MPIVWPILRSVGDWLVDSRLPGRLSVEAFPQARGQTKAAKTRRVKQRQPQLEKAAEKQRAF